MELFNAFHVRWRAGYGWVFDAPPSVFAEVRELLRTRTFDEPGLDDPHTYTTLVRNGVLYAGFVGASRDARGRAVRHYHVVAAHDAAPTPENRRRLLDALRRTYGEQGDGVLDGITSQLTLGNPAEGRPLLEKLEVHVDLASFEATPHFEEDEIDGDDEHTAVMPSPFAPPPDAPPVPATRADVDPMADTTRIPQVVVPAPRDKPAGLPTSPVDPQTDTAPIPAVLPPGSGLPDPQTDTAPIPEVIPPGRSLPDPMADTAPIPEVTRPRRPGSPHDPLADTAPIPEVTPPPKVRPAPDPPLPRERPRSVSTAMPERRATWVPPKPAEPSPPADAHRTPPPPPTVTGAPLHPRTESERVGPPPGSIEAEVDQALNTDQAIEAARDRRRRLAVPMLAAFVVFILITVLGIVWVLGDVDGDGARAKVLGGNDCDDRQASVHPDAQELPADGIDQDCDGKEICYVDQDGDGVGTTHTVEARNITCRGSHTSARTDDCDDDDDTRYPGADEVPGDGVDQDCDGKELCYVDEDGDGAAGQTTRQADLACSARDVGTRAEDCDDEDPKTHPGAKGRADGVDRDCDGELSPRETEVTRCKEGKPNRTWRDRNHNGIRDCLEDRPEVGEVQLEAEPYDPVVFRVLSTQPLCEAWVLTWHHPDETPAKHAMTVLPSKDPTCELETPGVTPKHKVCKGGPRRSDELAYTWHCRMQAYQASGPRDMRDLYVSGGRINVRN